VEPFTRWDASHLTALALTALTPLALAAWARRGEGDFRERAAGFGFAALLLGNLVAALLWREDRGLGWVAQLPLHLCDLAALACAATCLAHNRFSFEIAYFWGLAGTVHGLVSPDLPFGFPTPQFWIFFLGHGGIVASVIFLLVAPRLRPTPRSALKAYGALLGYGLLAGGANWAFGTNYGFLRSKPQGPSLLDHLGPWPWYILSLAGVAALSFVALALPWTLAKRKH